MMDKRNTSAYSGSNMVQYITVTGVASEISFREMLQSIRKISFFVFREIWLIFGESNKSRFQKKVIFREIEFFSHKIVSGVLK
jgi:hypothetical protein